MFRNWTRHFWHCYLSNCLCQITALELTVLLSSHHGHIYTIPMIKIVLMSILNHLEEAGEDRLPRLIIVTPVKFISLVWYVFCRFLVHHDRFLLLTFHNNRYVECPVAMADMSHVGSSAQRGCANEGALTRKCVM
jgi:hypothetical protein